MAMLYGKDAGIIFITCFFNHTKSPSCSFGYTEPWCPETKHWRSDYIFQQLFGMQNVFFEVLFFRFVKQKMGVPVTRDLVTFLFATLNKFFVSFRNPAKPE